MKKRPKLAGKSPALPRLRDGTMPPPSRPHVDRRKDEARKACRKRATGREIDTSGQD